jgi:transposase InsO family protein
MFKEEIKVPFPVIDVSLKKEVRKALLQLLVNWSHFKIINEARQVLFEYIEVFYNRQRVQKRLGYLSPIQWVKQWQRQASQLVA